MISQPLKQRVVTLVVRLLRHLCYSQQGNITKKKKLNELTYGFVLQLSQTCCLFSSRLHANTSSAASRTYLFGQVSYPTQFRLIPFVKILVKITYVKSNDVLRLVNKYSLK